MDNKVQGEPYPRMQMNTYGLGHARAKYKNIQKICPSAKPVKIKTCNRTTDIKQIQALSPNMQWV